jgi:endonuclease G
MFKYITTTLLLTISLQAQISMYQFANEMLSMTKEYNEKSSHKSSSYKKKKKSSNKDLKNNDYSLTKQQLNRSFSRNFINKQKCDRVISNKVVTTCYSDKYKSATKVAYVISATNVFKLDIEKRPSWKYNKKIPANKRSHNKDYPHTGYDKGHLAFDSAYDFNYGVLKNTYDLNINAVPMVANVNRKTWIKSEAYAKKVAKRLGYVEVIDLMEFGKYPKKMGKNKISVADGFYKIIVNDSKNFEECFYYKNDFKAKVKGDKLKNHRIDCSKVGRILNSRI